MEMIKALWAYRGFISGVVKREFQSKYRNSVLGATWTVINPLMMIVVYTVIFVEVMRSRMPGVSGKFGYSIYLCSGLLTWGLFAEVVARAQTVFLDNANILKKINFPRMCLPIIVLINSLINFAIIFGLFLIFLILTRNFPGVVFLWIIPVLLIQIVFSIGLGVILGVLNVFFRDVGQSFNIILQFWFWFTPIVYPINSLPNKIQTMILINPMARLIKSYQEIIVYNTRPDLSLLFPVAILGLVLCYFGLQLFRKHSGEIVDEL